MLQVDFDKLNKILESGTKEELRSFLGENDLEIKDGKITAKDVKELKNTVAYWDLVQLSTKLRLNGSYGAILQSGCLYFDQRIGQSTTLSGRCITKHMISTINEILTGHYDYEGETAVYGDTDSAYFTAWPILQKEVEAGKQDWNKDICVQMYDAIGEQVNDSFPVFMEQAFHTTSEQGGIIKCGRELVGSRGIFIKKKRYAIMIYDMEGERYDSYDEDLAKKKDVIFGIGKVKAMGLDLKRADTPEYVQKFLHELLTDVLTNVDKSDIVDKVIKFKKEFRLQQPWEMGTPKKVNAVAFYTKKYEARAKGGTIPGHVQAAIAWNVLRKMHNDNRAPAIVDGMKTMMCKLLPNPLGFTSVSYPIDIPVLPEWFKKLPFDVDAMEEAIVMKKVDNMIGILKLDIRDRTNIKTTFNSLFEY